MTWLWILLAVLVVLALVALAAFIGGYNKLVQGRSACDEAFATMDVYLKKRCDLIPNLIATVKESAGHEKQLLETALQAAQTEDKKDRVAAEALLSVRVDALLGKLAADPAQRENGTYLQFAKDLGRTEEDIANARKYYNAVVKEYNASLETIPQNFVAALGGFQPWPMFEVDADSQRANVQVDFKE